MNLYNVYFVSKGTGPRTVQIEAQNSAGVKAQVHAEPVANICEKETRIVTHTVAGFEYREAARGLDQRLQRVPGITSGTPLPQGERTVYSFYLLNYNGFQFTRSAVLLRDPGLPGRGSLGSANRRQSDPET